MMMIDVDPGRHPKCTVCAVLSRGSDRPALCPLGRRLADDEPPEFRKFPSCNGGRW